MVQIDVEYDRLPGDCALSAAFVTYLGPFEPRRREFFVNFWLKSLGDTGAPHDPGFELAPFLTDPAAIRNWNDRGLFNDRFSVENGIIIGQSRRRYPLVIDPQGRAARWIENIESSNGLKIVDCRSASNDCVQDIEMAVQRGHPTLLRIGFENVDPRILSILSNSVVKESLLRCFIKKPVSGDCVRTTETKAFERRGVLLQETNDSYERETDCYRTTKVSEFSSLRRRKIFTTYEK